MRRILLLRTMNIKNRIIKTIISLALLIVVLVSLNPNKVPVVFVILPFVLIFFTTLNLWQLMLSLKNRGKEENAEFNKQTSVAAGLLVTLIVVLQSIGQLTLRDVGTLLLLFVLGYFYIVRMRTKRQ